MSCACTQDRIPLVNPGFSARVLRQEPRLVWSFWVAAGLAAAGGAMPFLVGGSSSRISNVYIPYAIGAVAFGAAALWHDRGRAVTGGLYFVAGLAQEQQDLIGLVHAAEDQIGCASCRLGIPRVA